MRQNDNEGPVFFYDPQGRIIRQRNHQGMVTIHHYDHNNRLIGIRQEFQHEDGQNEPLIGVRQEFWYEGNHNLRLFPVNRDAGPVAVYHYDANNRRQNIGEAEIRNGGFQFFNFRQDGDNLGNNHPEPNLGPSRG